MCKLKANKKKRLVIKTVYILAVGSFNTPNPHSLPLADSFDFDFSFSILPDIISNNMPIPFL